MTDMTAKISQQIDRIQKIVQDETEDTWTRAKVLEQHSRELTQLSRRNLFGRIEWINAVSGTSQYTLDNVAVEVMMVLYNEKVLTFAHEDHLDHRKPGWENLVREPEYWTVNNQSPNVIRIIPAPLRTGSTVPVFPAVPLAQNAVDNLVVFYFEDIAERAGNEVDDFPVLDAFEDPVVLRSVQGLAEQERLVQDLPLATMAGELAKLWLGRLGVE